MPKRVSKHLKTAARAEAAALAANANAAYEVSRRRQAEQWAEEAQHALDEARYTLGSNHMALPPQFMGVTFERGNQPMQFSPPQRMMGYNPHASMEPLHMKISDLYALVADLDDDEISHAIHARVELARECVTYAISVEAIEQMPVEVLQARLTKEISIRMAELLAKRLKQRFARSPA